MNFVGDDYLCFTWTCLDIMFASR